MAYGVGPLHPFIRLLRSQEPLDQLAPAEEPLRQQLMHEPLDLRPRDPGELFPPLLLQRQQEGVRQQSHRDMMLPARPGPHFIIEIGPAKAKPPAIRVTRTRWQTSCASGCFACGPRLMVRVVLSLTR
jgi:hypothetical protein